MDLSTCCLCRADPPVQFLDDEKRAKYIVAVDRDGQLRLSRVLRVHSRDAVQGGG